MIAPANASPNESPNDPGGVHAGGLADPLLGDRRERVVVQLGDQEAQPAPAITSGTRRYQPVSARGTTPRSARRP